MAGNNIDKSVNVSSALRDSILDHAHGSKTFAQHYLNRNICADLWAIQRDREPQQKLLEQATSHGATVSSHRPTRLTAADVEEAKSDSQAYQDLTQRLSKCPRGTPKHRELKARQKSLLQGLRNEKLEQVRASFRARQAKEDINRQIEGRDIICITSDSAFERPRGRLGRAQKAMMDALEAPLLSDLDGQNQRRTDAIKALVAYCTEVEPIVPKLTDTYRARAPVDTTLTPEETLDQIRQSTLRDVAGEVRRCFICVDRAMHAGYEADDPRFQQDCHLFANELSLRKHFYGYLDMHEAGENWVCRISKVTLIHKEHLQNHADTVHGIRTPRDTRRLPKKIRKY